MTDRRDIVPAETKRGRSTDELTFKLLEGVVAVSDRFIDCGGVIQADSREKPDHRYPFEGLPSVVKKLDEGDYSIVGFEKVFAIERKSVGDLTSTLGTWANRQRFERELARFSNHKRVLLLCEGEAQDVLRGRYHSPIAPAAVMASLASISARRNITVFFAGGPKSAEFFARVWLLSMWSRFHKSAEAA